MNIVRYADDLTVGFQHEAEARRFLEITRARLKEFSLSLHPDKTRLIEFGRFATANRKQRGLGKPETFNFLGFTFISGKSRRGHFLIKRKTRRERMQAKLQEIKKELRERMRQPIPKQGQWLKQIVTGYFHYHHIAHLWLRVLRRRSQRDRSWSTSGSRKRISSIPGPASASPSITQRGSRVPESGSHGSVWGVPNNGASLLRSIR